MVVWGYGLIWFGSLVWFRVVWVVEVGGMVGVFWVVEDVVVTKPFF